MPSIPPPPTAVFIMAALLTAILGLGYAAELPALASMDVYGDAFTLGWQGLR